METNTFDTIVIGAGQAGLAAGYHLAKRGEPFLILDAHDRVGGSWHDRWDSLSLFTPAIRNSLPGDPFGREFRFQPKDELLAYFAEYADRNGLPVRTDTPVDGVFAEGDGYRVTSGTESFLARNVVLATGAHRKPRTPSFAAELSPDIVQLHSVDYRNPRQLQPGTVLLVGAGNSGAEIAMDLAGTHDVLLAGVATSATCPSTSAAGRDGCCSRSSGGCGSTCSPSRRSPVARPRPRPWRGTASS